MYNKNCIQCNNFFVAKFTFEKLCSSECKRLRGLWRNKKWFDKVNYSQREYVKVNALKKYHANKEKIKQMRKRNRLKNLDYIHQQDKKYYKYRMQNDIQYRLRKIIRDRLNAARGLEYKYSCSLSVLGCSISNYKIFLENKFKDGMTWSNHGRGLGKWHIDHIIPVCKFDLTKEEEQKKAFHYTNTQPLWEEENLIKNRF